MSRRTLLSVLVAGSVVAITAAGGAWATSDRSLPSTDPGDPGGITSYTLTIEGRSAAHFSDLVAMTSGADPSILVTTSGEKVVKTLLPAKRPPDAVVLRRGLTTNTDLAAWHDLVLDGNVAAARIDATLTMLASDGSPVARYHLENAWPSKLEHGELTSGGTSLVMETVTLVCDRIQRVAV